MRRENIISFVSALMAGLLVSVSCSREEFPGAGPSDEGGVVRTSLQYAGFGGAKVRGSDMVQADYDRVEFLVADSYGNIQDNIKGYYDASSSSICIEGLQPGDYTLLVAGVKGDWSEDGMEFLDISHASQVWLRFPEDRSRALTAEYFHSATDFTVRLEQGQSGLVPVADLPGRIEQRRVVGRLDVSLIFGNPYLADAILSARTVLDSPVFSTEISGDGKFSGSAGVRELSLDMVETGTFLLLPTADGHIPDGTVTVETRNYLGDRIRRSYSVNLQSVMPNHVSELRVEAVHPEDGNGTMFITDKAYSEGGHSYILQDDEHHEVYTDRKLRSFDTSEPMQVTVTEEGELSIRFYSPKPVSGVLIRARIPSVGDEYVDLAYFDTVPAFADFHARIPALDGKAVYRTASGRIVEVPQLGTDELRQAEFSIVSEDPYWAKLRKIAHGWNVRFGLYGGDPTKPDGGPQGNWMGIRPVHCREVVAFFLNFTYMIDMPEHEAILRANEDRLYGNGGVDDKVTAETVLAQMRQKRSVQVGLVYTGNLVMGLGGGEVFGAYQGGWFEHYTSAYACEVMFHELGHVMGYSHDSSFTYGPWAQELMNNFYIDNLWMMPVESPHYLDSASNPNKY